MHILILFTEDELGPPPGDLIQLILPLTVEARANAVFSTQTQFESRVQTNETKLSVSVTEKEYTVHVLN